MSTNRKGLFAFVLVFMAGLLGLGLPAAMSIWGAGGTNAVSAQQACEELFDPKNLPAPALIDFDTLADTTVIQDSYQPTFGVLFEDNRLTHAIIYGGDSGTAHSPPNTAFNDAVAGTSEGVPLRITFDTPKTHVGFYIGNGDGQTMALLMAFDAQNNLICEVSRADVQDAHSTFIGIWDAEGRIKYVTLDYGQTTLGESIDDLYFSPRQGLPPARTPLPTWTAIPTALPTQGPAPTPTPVVPLLAYEPYVPSVIYGPPIVFPDFGLHGIEITQAIQCFDPSKGLSAGTCANNSLPVITKKDATARIYVKANNSASNYNNLPVRLYIRAAGVWYTANVSGDATSAIDQNAQDSANVYFNVNFSNDVVVDFYAEVDPDDYYTETNESNNRYPAAGYLTLTFRRREALKIVGQRLRYHPSGYSGAQYAGGWAVNGGASDWFEQMLPIRNNGINYVVKSGYMDWTTSLGDHNLIQALNIQWILENVFSFWFSGTFTNADHVYGWVPNDGYTGGHADMPVYPHAGGLGVVAIGTDRPGTNTDNPAGGALILGHELIHDYDVFHTNTFDACGSNDGNSDFPYSNSSIQEFGFNPITGKIYNPSNTHDVMSYCPAGGSRQGWISPFTWNRMFSEFSPAATIYRPELTSAPPGIFHRTEATEVLVVNATVFNPDYSPPALGQLGDLYKVETDVAYLPPQGPYAVELRDSQGATLHSQPFVVDFESEYDAHNDSPQSPDDPPPFPPEPTTEVGVSFAIPWIDGTTIVALTYQGEVLDQKMVSNNPPQVFITEPSQEEEWLPGSTHALAWQGLDLDGDPISYTLAYSNDGGSNWVVLSSLISDTLDIPVDSLGGGSDARFRVVATDGLLTGMDETDFAISIPNQFPLVTILYPTGGIYQPGALVVLQGFGTDFEDGSLPDSALVWSSDLQGGLGIGPSVALNSLNAGEHTITLTGMDSYGYTSTATVRINIAYPSFVPVVQR